MPKKIENEIDYLVAQSQTETDIAKEILESVRKKDETRQSRYYEEKLALKMLDFFKLEEKLISLYAEAKTEYPLLADLMENKRPYLRDMLEEAKRLFIKNFNNDSTGSV